MQATETSIPSDGLTESARFRPARAWVGPLILFLVVTAFFWKLLLINQYSWLETPDLANQVLPWFHFEAEQFQHHRLPIWDPYLLGGQSLIGQDQPGLAYPLNWLLFSVLLHNGRVSYSALNWYYMLIHYFAALFCYLLCRDLGRSVIASILGGLAFGLGGYIGTTDWPQMINAAIWAPLVFLFLFRSARGVRPLANAAFSGLFLGISWLGGHHQIPIFLSLAAGAVWLYFLFEHGRFQRSRIAPVAVFLAFFLCAGALQMWPAYSYGRTAVRWVGSDHDPIRWDESVPYNVHQRYSLTPVYLLGLIMPGYMDFVSPYVGVVALSLAGLALVCWWKTKEIRILCGVGLAGLFLAMAKNDVFHGILYSIVPLVEKARSPATAIYLFHFAIAVLVAFGLDSLVVPSFRPVLRRLTIVLLTLGTAMFAITFGILLGKAMAWPGDDRIMMSILAAFALAGLFYRAGRSDAARAGLLTLIVALYIVEVGNVTLYALPHKEDKNRSIFLQHYGETRQVAEFLQRQPAPLRVWVNGDDVNFNFGDWYGIDMMNGYVAGMPFNVNQLEIHTTRTRMLYGAAYTVAKKPLFEGQQEVFRDDKGLTVYKSATVLPRVWTVHDSVRVSDPADARRHLQDPGFDLQNRTFGYFTPPRMEQCSGDTVQSFSRGINGVTVFVDMKCRGMVVMSENNAAGWKAFVDGREVPMFDAYTALRGIVVDSGRHKIETRYRPLSVFAGAATTLTTLLAALALWLAPKRRQ